MPSTLGKNLNLCFTKIKHPLASQSTAMNQIPTPPPNHPHNHQSRPFPTNTNTNTSTTSTSILIKNFNSLYEYTFDSKSLTHSPSSLSTSSSVSETAPAAADFATAFASQRFFFSTPGRSNSIVESTSPSTTGGSATPAAIEFDHSLFNNSVAVPTLSPDPYADFRRSMQEMVEAREIMNVEESNWEFLHELLLCYLALNPKSTHKFIIGAFSDLLVSLMPPPHSDSSGQQENDFVAAATAAAAAGVCEISRQCT